MRISFAIVALFFVSVQLQANMCTPPVEPTDIQKHENIIYKKDLGLDLYLPSEGENFPLAFIVHGGSWIAGDRKDFTSTAKRLTGMGYAAATVSYTLAKGSNNKFPVPVEDLRCAVRTLRKIGKDLGINTEKIIGLGQSAGAHLVASLALTADRFDFNDSLCPVKNESPSIESVIGYFGPYDLRKTTDLNFGQIMILSNLLGGLPQFKPKLAELASPVAQINDENVPFFLVHAANDDVVPVRSSQEFTDALIQEKKEVSYVELSDGKHQISYFDERPFAQEATCGTLNHLNLFKDLL